MLNPEVTKFLNELNHPFRDEIEALRKTILASHSELIENIKWNAPNYAIKEEDRITMRVQPPKKQVQLILHRGAKKQEQPKEKQINHNSKLLHWKENDRAIITFNSMQEIKDSKHDLQEILIAWIV